MSMIFNGIAIAPTRIGIPAGPEGAPTGLSATANGETQIDLAWTDNSDDETGFKVYRSTDNVTFSLLHTTAANATTYSNTGLTAGSTYWYYVVATNATGDSDPTETVSATTDIDVLSQDLFTDTNGTGLDAHTPDVGGNWTEHAGTWEIQSGHAEQTNTGVARYFATVDAGVANARISVAIKPTHATDSQGGVVVRYVDTSNYWWIQRTGSALNIYEVTAGVTTLRDTVSYSYTANTYEELTVICDGNEITATIEGGYSVTYNSTSHNTSTRFGLQSTQHINHFDEWQVVPLPTYPFTRQGNVLTASFASENSNLQEVTVIREGDPQVLTGETTVFKMWYLGGGFGSGSVGIYYAESTDGETWTKYGDTRLVEDLAHFQIQKIDDTYYLYGTIYVPDWTQYDLYTSSDGISWTLDTAAVLEVGTAGQWDDEQLGNVWVMKEGASDWKMIYEAQGGGNWQLGYATSTDGRSWTKHGSNPVLNRTEGAGGPHIVKDGEYYVMWVHTGLPSYIKRWRSTDLTSWAGPAQTPFGVIIPREGADEGENSANGQVADPFPLEYNGQVYLYFEASSDGTAVGGAMHIELATADIRALSGW